MKLFWTFFFIFYGLGLATEIQEAPSVFVELHSGTKQNAKYLGFVQDTVILGGYIQNEYTEIKLHIQAFKSIKDSSGHELLLDLLKTKDRKSTRLNSSHVRISYAVFCLKKK